MPSLTYTRAQLAWSGGQLMVEPVRVSYDSAMLGYAGGDIEVGPNLSNPLEEKTVRLDRLQRAVAVSDRAGSPTVQFQALWQKTVESIEDAFSQQGSQIDEISSILAAIQAVQETATQAALDAQNVSDEVSLANSTTVPVDGLLSASSTGGITVAAHQRQYSNNTVNVDAGSVSGFAPGAFVRVYYNDSAREGGAVTFMGTMDEIVQTGSVHVVGGVTIPQIGQPDASGTGSTPPGYVRDFGLNIDLL